MEHEAAKDRHRYRALPRHRSGSLTRFEHSRYVLFLKILTVCAHEKFSISGTPSIQTLLHLSFPAFRVLLLTSLWAALIYPRISYSPIAPGDEESPTASSLLLPSSDGVAPSQGLAPLVTDASKYGTFRISRSLAPTPSGPTTRSPTPAPTSARIPQPKVCITLANEISDLITRLC